jgi:hypothetical protein
MILYTVCSNPQKIAAFSLGLEKAQKSYATLTNEFQLTKSVKEYVMMTKKRKKKKKQRDVRQ